MVHLSRYCYEVRHIDTLLGFQHPGANYFNSILCIIYLCVLKGRKRYTRELLLGYLIDDTIYTLMTVKELFIIDWMLILECYMNDSRYKS